MTKSFQHHIERILNDDTHETVIIHCGTNDLRPRAPVTPSTEVEIVNRIREIGQKCKNSGVEDVIVSGIIRRNDFEVDSKRRRINKMLKSMCDKTGFHFLCNENITFSQLWKDGLHLSNRGIGMLSNNFSKYLNNITYKWLNISTLNSVNILNDAHEAITDLKELRLKYPTNVIASFININSIRNKLMNLETIINRNVDALAIAETKIDDSFTTSSLRIEGHNPPLRLDSSKSSGGLLVYVNEDIPLNQLNKFPAPEDIQVIPFELNLRK